MKTLRQISDDEQIEAIANDPSADKAVRKWAQEVIKAETDHEARMSTIRRQDKFLRWTICICATIATSGILANIVLLILKMLSK